MEIIYTWMAHIKREDSMRKKVICYVFLLQCLCNLLIYHVCGNIPSNIHAVFCLLSYFLIIIVFESDALNVIYVL